MQVIQSLLFFQIKYLVDPKTIFISKIGEEKLIPDKQVFSLIQFRTRRGP